MALPVDLPKRKRHEQMPAVFRLTGGDQPVFRIRVLDIGENHERIADQRGFDFSQGNAVFSAFPPVAVIPIKKRE